MLINRNIIWVFLFACISLIFQSYASAQTTVTFQLNWTAGGANAGFAAAIGEGYYKDVGLEVTLVQGNGSGNTAQLVASGRAQLGFAEAVAVTQLIAKGAPMKIVATLYQANSSEVNALKSTNIKSIADLKGKKVGVPTGSAQTTMLPLFLSANGLKESDLTLMNMPVAAMVPALLQGQVDAILGSSDSYRVQLEMQGAKVDYFPFSDYGVPTVSTGIFAADDYISKNPEILKKFIAASIKGWVFAIKNQSTAIKHLKNIFPDANEKTSAAELANIPPLFCAGGARYIGKVEDAHWLRTQDLLSQVKLLPAGENPKKYYTNDFLPPDSLLQPCK